ncbi:MAG: hypothetical protein JSU06_10330 [Actinobacteria bacterium]|nr:hypothetical protein [Actinomycetota bacterium]
MSTTTQMTKTDAAPIRRFLARALADDAVADEVNDAVFASVVEGDGDPAALAEKLPACIRRALDDADADDWRALAAGLIGEAREMEDEAEERRPLRFIDHHRQRYAGKVPIPEEGEFIIGSQLEDGSLGEDGEFRVTLVGLGCGRRWALHPHLEAFGDGRGALRRAIDGGLLEAIARPVAGREEFARRLLAIGMVDGSDEPLPQGEGS